MPLDLSHPRHILPFSPSSSSPPATESNNSKIVSPATSQPPIQGQRAIQLKLTDQVLAHLVELARTSGLNLEKGKVQLDLRNGHQPAIVINGVSHPITLNPEPVNSEVLRLSPSSRDLQPIATITHKATIQPDLKAERLAKASQNLKLSREKEEREKESKKAVLLDVAPSTSRSSSLNRGRPSQLASSPPSRTASPSNSTIASTQPKHPPRLTATSVKPPSSSFRIGKGVAPNAIRNKPRTNSSHSSSSSTSTPVASPPPIATSTSALEPNPHPTAIAPTRQFSSSSNSSTNSESSKPLSSAISTSTIGTSPESLTLPLTSGSGTAIGISEKGEVVTEPAVVKKAGGGGVMKGKESLKKEAKKVNGATAKSGSIPNSKGKGKEREVDPEDMDAEGEVDDAVETAGGETEEDSRANAKKKRKLLHGLAVESSSRNSSSDRGSDRERERDRERDMGKGKDRERGRSSVPIKTVIKTVEKVAPTSESEGRHSKSDHKKGESSRGRERERERERERDREKEKSKKRKKQETSRWYSSDSEDGEVKPTNGNHSRPPPSSSKPLHSDLPAKPSIASHSSFPSSTSHLAPPNDSSSSFHSIRSRFYELYAPYAVLHSRLTSIRSALERGQRIKESPKELRSLAEECEKRRLDLEGQKVAMSRCKSIGGKG